MNTTTKSIFPGLVEVNFTNSVNFIQKYSNYLDFVSTFTNELSAYLAFDASNYSSDFVNSNINVFSNLNSKFSDFDNEFINYYIRKYNLLVDDIKNALNITLSANNFFIDLSDSIGLLTNSESLLNDTVIPFNDLGVSIYPAPITYTSNTRNKIRSKSKAVSVDLSTKTTALFRNNIINIQTIYATTSESHGSNLITDFNSYIRTRNFITILTNQLSNDFDKIFKLVTYFSNINDFEGYNTGNMNDNLQSIDRIQYSQNIEGATMQLDLLGKRIKAVRSNNTIQQSLAISENQSSTIQINPVTINSTKAYPLNSTAPLAGNNINTSIPTPVQKSSQDEQAIKTNIQNTSTVKVSTSPVNVSKNISTVSTVSPEFSRTPYAFVSDSPFAALNVIRNTVCAAISTIKQTLDKLSGIGLPKMPGYFKSKTSFKSAFTALFIKAEKMIIDKLKSLIPTIPKMPDFKVMFKDFGKKLFNCNKANKL